MLLLFCPNLSMPCPTALARRLGLSGAVTGTNIKPCTHAVQCNNYPIPPLLSWSLTTPSRHHSSSRRT